MIVRLRGGVVDSDTFSDESSWARLKVGGKGFSGRHRVHYEHPLPPGEGGGTYRYVLGMNYWEQFSNAVRNYFALACVADGWRARTLRPYTAHSRLYGLPNLFLDDHFNESSTAHDLGLILEPSSMDSVLIDTGLRPTAPLEEILKHGDRGLIFVHFVSVISNREYSIQSIEASEFVWDAFQKSNTVDCSNVREFMNLARLVASNLNSRLGLVDSNSNSKLGNKALFYTRAYVCISTSHGLNSKILAKQMAFDEGNASIVVINWRGVGNGSELIHSSKGAHPNKRVTLKDKKCLDRKHKGKISNIHFSKSVLNAADKYLSELGVKEGEFLVVHFRSEKLVFRESRFPRLLSNCVNEALQKRDEVVLVDGVRTQDFKVLYFADIGTFGSETCKHCSSVNQMERLMIKYNFQLSHFSPMKYNLLPDRGFVAAVEMTVMSHAGHMILVGGGSFQTQLLQRFNSQASKQSATLTLCSNDQQARQTTRRFSPPIQ